MSSSVPSGPDVYTTHLILIPQLRRHPSLLPRQTEFSNDQKILMGSIEDRRHPRVNVEFFADWGWGPECEYYDKVTSLSISGCFLATKRELNSGQEIYIRLTGEVAGTINLKGAVRYLLRVMEGAPPAGAGIEFINVSPDTKNKIQTVMNSYR